MNKTLRAVLFIGAVDLLARGTDYLLGSPNQGTNMVFANNMPTYWGFACVVSAFVIFVGVASRNFRVCILGCLLSFSVYTIFGYSLFESTILNHPPDDWRLISSHWTKAALFLILAVSLVFRHGVLDILKRRKEDRGGIE